MFKDTDQLNILSLESKKTVRNNLKFLQYLKFPIFENMTIFLNLP